MNHGETNSQVTDYDALISALKAGQPGALRIIHEMFYPSLYLLAGSILEDLPEAEDIAAESIIKLWTKHRDFDNLPAIKKFLFVTTRNASLNSLRDRKRHAEHANILMYLLESQDDYVLMKMMDQELYQEIRTQVEKLPNKPGRIIKEFFFHNKTIRQISEELNMLEATVLTNKSRGIQELRNKIVNNNLLPVAASVASLILAFYIPQIIFPGNGIH